MDLAGFAATMSLSGESDGVPMRRLTSEQRRQVLYVAVFPNLLVSLHPDYVMTHRIEPVSAARTIVECQWLFAPEALEAPDFDPSYAVDFWDLTNRQDWAAVESVQRGLSHPAFVPGVLAEQESDVYRFVTMVARGYRGEPIRGGPSPALDLVRVDVEQRVGDPTGLVEEARLLCRGQRDLHSETVDQDRDHRGILRGVALSEDSAGPCRPATTLSSAASNGRRADARSCGALATAPLRPTSRSTSPTTCECSARRRRRGARRAARRASPSTRRWRRALRSRHARRRRMPPRATRLSNRSGRRRAAARCRAGWRCRSCGCGRTLGRAAPHR